MTASGALAPQRSSSYFSTWGSRFLTNFVRMKGFLRSGTKLTVCRKEMHSCVSRCFAASSAALPKVSRCAFLTSTFMTDLMANSALSLLIAGPASPLAAPWSARRLICLMMFSRTSASVATSLTLPRIAMRYDTSSLVMSARSTCWKHCMTASCRSSQGTWRSLKSSVSRSWAFIASFTSLHSLSRSRSAVKYSMSRTIDWKQRCTRGLCRLAKRGTCDDTTSLRLSLSFTCFPAAMASSRYFEEVASMISIIGFILSRSVAICSVIRALPFSSSRG